MFYIDMFDLVGSVLYYLCAIGNVFQLMGGKESYNY